jgi:hypothetical protein
VNRYKVLLPVTLSDENGDYTQGDEFEKEYTAEEEADLLAFRGGGLLEIVPREYKVVGEANVHETEPGGTFTAAMTIGQEKHLVDGGFVERVEPPPVKPKATRKKKEA